MAMSVLSRGYANRRTLYDKSVKTLPSRVLRMQAVKNTISCYDLDRKKYVTKCILVTRGARGGMHFVILPAQDHHNDFIINGKCYITTC